MKKLLIPLIVGVLLAGGLALLRAQQPDYASRKAEAEKQYQEGSYARAYEIYSAFDASKLSAQEARWVQFRSADSLWRSEAATETSDSTKLDEARTKLEELIRDIQREEDKDLVWAEVHESLGDYFWSRRDSHDWNSGWQHYSIALDWWAGSDQLKPARDRYLGIVWKAARPQSADTYYYYGYYGNMLPLDILRNALKIAETENDRAHAHYLIAMTLRYQGGTPQRNSAAEEFEAAIKSGKGTDWYDDALFYYAQWLEQSGRIQMLQTGQMVQQPDFKRALEIYRLLLSQYVKGQSRYYDQAKQRIEDITRPVVGISVSNIFLPGSEVQYSLNWRNVSQIDLALYQVDLTRDPQFSGNQDSYDWLKQIGATPSRKVKSWVKATNDAGDHQPGQETTHIEGKLNAGAYVIEARSGDLNARDLILITDTALVVKLSGRQALFFYCNALNSAPIPSARITVWERFTEQSNLIWRQRNLTTNKDGLAQLDLAAKSDSSTELFAAAAAGDRQAFTTANSYSYRADFQLWRIYAYTDRPAYRPGETAQWKFTARQYNGSVYSTPANQTLEYEIYDPRGTKITEGESKLNTFGSAWGSLDLKSEMPLGEYRINFYDEGRHTSIGSATLFRLEEYKLPEFKVKVQTPEENGKRKTFQLGDNVEVNIQAEYYFGGPVSNATVELLVYQNPFYMWWPRPHEYSWYYEDMDSQSRYWYGGGGSIVKRETLKTDAEGKATLTFETPANSGQDFQYRIEARVTDASRREITATDAVHVTRQSYYVFPAPDHFLYRPQDKVQIDIKAIDANQQPVAAEGSVKVTRDFWFEIWLDPNGKEVKGDELNALRGKLAIFPPVPQQGQQPWTLKFRGYQHDDILTRTVKTDAEGKAEFTFTPEREGYYRVAWSSSDKNSAPINAETTVWVATNSSTELGYRTGGLEIIMDKDTFHKGQTAPILLSVPTSDRYVLFTVEAQDLLSYQLVHLTGTVKLVELPIEEKHVPNIFLGGVLVSDGQIFMDSKQVVVPPADHFLNVDVTPDRKDYQPQEQGTFTVTTTDATGKPVSAEVALGVADESVFYIQQDYAGDPRPFFFGQKRALGVQTNSTLQIKSFVRLVEGDNGALKDGLSRQYLDNVPSARDATYFDFDSQGGGRRLKEEFTVTGESAVVDGKVAGLAKSNAAPPPAPQSAPKPEPAVEPSAVTVRSDFRSTVFWQPDVMTDANGKAVVKVKYPDSLTGWTTNARVATASAQFGIGNASTRTRQPLIARLQAPRFFLAGDSVTVSAVLNNNTDSAMTVNATLEADGLALPKIMQPPVNVPANGEARIDWQAMVVQPGNARLKITARGDKYSDAMEKTYPVYEHGIERFIAKSGTLRSDEAIVNLEIPAARKKDSTQLTVQVTPSMAVTMLDALPYLIDYPYGCTEQTMSRFLPAVIVSKTLKDLGISKGNIDERIFGGIEQNTAAKTHPGGKKDLRKLDDMVKAGLDRLYDFQHSDGGWGWWKEGESDHFMTAYVLWGLTLAHNAGVEYAKDTVAARAADFLATEIVEEEDAYDEQAWMLHAIAVYRNSHRAGAGEFEAKAFDNLWKNRDRLNAYTRALLALSAQAYGYTDKAQILVRNLENGVKKDTAPDTSIVMRGPQSSNPAVMGTARWGEDGIWWRWSDGGIESTAFALRALLAIDPKNPLVEPVTNWLIKNRRGAQWSNTRDTAITVLTLSDYLRTSGELKTDLEYEVTVNGASIASRHVTPQDILSAPSRYAIDRNLIRDGANEIRIQRKTGSGPLYFAAQSEFFSLEEPVPASGSEMFVRRQYYKLVGKPTLLKGYVYERRPLNDNDTVKSGERVETVVTIETKNNYEYLVFEDLKPAGFEAVEIRSGESLFARQVKSGAVSGKMTSANAGNIDQIDYTGEQRWVYQELRDRKVALFVDKLPQGVWEIRYDMRAEVPGRFHALPLTGQAMYVPEIRANGAEIRVTVQD